MTICFVRDPDQYNADIYVDSDDSSELERRFAYQQHDLPQYLRASPYSLTTIAAYIGDLGFLDHLRQCYGGVLYDNRDLLEALSRGHIEFFLLYLELATGSFLQGDASGELGRYEPVANLLYYEMNFIVDALPLLQHLYERVILLLPPIADLVQYGRRVVRVRNPDWIEQELLAHALEQVHMRPDLLRYLVEERGLRFNREHVRTAAGLYRPRLYAYVLSRLKPDLDPAQIRMESPLLPVSDAVLLSELAHNFGYFVWARDQGRVHACETLRVFAADLISADATLILKAVYLSRILPSLGHSDLRRKLCFPVDCRDERDEEETVDRMATFLRGILLDPQFEWGADINLSMECRVDPTKYVEDRVACRKP